MDLARENSDLRHRKKGWLRHQENFAQHPKLTQLGVVFLLFSSVNHPGLAISGGFAIILLIARPPLLAVMRLCPTNRRMRSSQL